MSAKPIPIDRRRNRREGGGMRNHRDRCVIAVASTVSLPNEVLSGGWRRIAEFLMGNWIFRGIKSARGLRGRVPGGNGVGSR
jgi:hypothetical protein